MIYDAGEKDAYELPAETVNLIFCSVFASKNMGKNKCEVCDCTECECISVDVSEPLLRTKKVKKTFRAQRATPSGEGIRWKAVEKTKTTWGSPADKARKREAMRVKQQRKWREAFVPEENIGGEPVKARKIREPVYDLPCNSPFAEYTGKGWPQCGESVVYRAPVRQWPIKL